MATKTDLEGERMYRDGLERWYAERGSREFPGVFVFPPLKPPPSPCWCGEPGKWVGRGLGGGVACATHFPRGVS